MSRTYGSEISPRASRLYGSENNTSASSPEFAFRNPERQATGHLELNFEIRARRTSKLDSGNHTHRASKMGLKPRRTTTQS